MISSILGEISYPLFLFDGVPVHDLLRPQLLPTGYLAYWSGFLPGLWGILLVIDSIAVVTWFLQVFLLSVTVISYPGLAVIFVTEVSVTTWILVKER